MIPSQAPAPASIVRFPYHHSPGEFIATANITSVLSFSSSSLSRSSVAADPSCAHHRHSGKKKKNRNKNKNKNMIPWKLDDDRFCNRQNEKDRKTNHSHRHDTTPNCEKKNAIPVNETKEDTRRPNSRAIELEEKERETKQCGAAAEKEKFHLEKVLATMFTPSREPDVPLRPSALDYRALLLELLLYRKETLEPVLAALRAEREALHQQQNELNSKIKELAGIRDEIREELSRCQAHDEAVLRRVIQGLSKPAGLSTPPPPVSQATHSLSRPQKNRYVSQMPNENRTLASRATPTSRREIDEELDF